MIPLHDGGSFMSAETVKQLGIKPKIAMLSYSNFGSAGGEDAIKMKKAVEIIESESTQILPNFVLIYFFRNFFINEIINLSHEFVMLSFFHLKLIIFFLILMK